MAMVGVCFGLGISRWHALLKVQGLAVPWERAAGIFFIGAFFNSFMLGVTGGDISKAYYVARETHHKRTEAVVTIVVDRIIGLLGMILFCLLVVALNLGFLIRAADVRLRLATVVVLLAMLGTVACAAFGFWKSLPQKLPLIGWLRERIPLGMREVLGRAAQAYQMYARHPRTVLYALALSLGVHAATTAVTVAVAQGMSGIEVPLRHLFLALPLINFLTAIPISIGGLGVREGLHVGLLVPLGISEAQAVGLSLLYFGCTLLWNLAGGAVFLFWKKPPAPNPE